MSAARPPSRHPKADSPAWGGDAAGVSSASRIGLFGGSFDPVHNAHLALARLALDKLPLDEVRWVPVGNPWQKARPITAAAHRVAMLELALQGETHHTLERCELERQGPSYTLDTVRELQHARPDAVWFLIIGQDQYVNLHTWHGHAELLRRVTLAVAQRPQASASADKTVAGAVVRRLRLPAMPVSGSEIRARVAAGQDIDALVPPAVAHYIHQHRLYRGTPGS